MPTLTDDAAADLFRAEPAAFIDMGDVAVAHRQIGSGPAVLFVHGWPVHGATFRRLLPHLVDHVTCHVVDLPGAGSSRYDTDSRLSISRHIEAVRATIDHLVATGSEGVALVGHDSGGLIARHAADGRDDVRGLGLINTEPEQVGWRFTSFIAGRKVPGFGKILSWAAGKPSVRRNKFVLGDAFADRSHLDGDFDEFFLRPLAAGGLHLDATIRLLESFDTAMIDQLAGIHARTTAPVRLVWGDQDPFFPVASARAMVGSFPDATLVEIPGAGLFSHEEAPQQVAEALLPVLT